MGVIALASIGVTLFRAYPEEVSVRYELGEAHGEVLEARIVYSLDGEEAKGVRFFYPDGVEGTAMRHRVELSPGRYEVKIDLILRDGNRSHERILIVPSDGVVQIDLVDKL